MKEIFCYYNWMITFLSVLLECFHFIPITYCSFTSWYICRLANAIRGHPFMTSTKNQVFDPPPPVHMRPHGTDPLPLLWASTHGRHEIHTALLKWLVQCPTAPKAEIRLYH